MNPLSDLGDDTRQMTGAIFTTFPFDVEFHEQAVMNVLSKKGIGSKNVVLVDSSKYHQTFDEESRRPSAGVNYHLAPVSVEGRRVFHPKIYFFGGERRVYAFVGSANLTQKGFTDNAELWTSFSFERNKDDEDLEQLVVLKEIREFLIDLLESEFSDAVGELPREVVSEILESCAWMDDVDVSEEIGQGTSFLHNLERPVLNQVLENVEGSIEEAVIAAPYFGETDRVLQELISQGVSDLELYLQQGKAQFDSESLDDLADDDAVSLKIFESSRFAHGKLLLLKTEEESYCLTGSANPSIQGMIKSAENGGNVESDILRKADTPDYFDYLVEDEIVGDIVGSAAEEFTPAELPSIEDEPTDLEQPEIRILDAVYNSETTFTGGRLRLSVSSLDLDEGRVLVSGEEGSFELSVSEAEFEEGGGDASELAFDIKSEERREVLNSICKVQVVGEGVESQFRWLGHKSVEEEEIVREGVESGATANTPEQIPDFLLGEEDLRAEVLHTVGQIINNLDKVDAGGDRGGSGGHRKTLPPDWESSGSTTSKDPDEFLEDLYDAWMEQMDVLIQHMGETDSEVLVQDFSRYVEAMNKATLHLMVIDNHAERLGYENQVDFRYIPRSRFRDLYQGSGSVVATFISRLIRREVRQEGEADLDAIYEATFQYLFPQVALTSMLAQEENEDHRRYYGEWVESAASHCFSDRHPMPLHLENERVDGVVNEIQASIREVLGRYDEESVVYRHLEHQYRDEGQVRDQVLEIYARTIVADGSTGVKQYYQRVYELIQNKEIDDIRGNASRCSAFISKTLGDDELSNSKVVSTLEEIEEDWCNVQDQYRTFLEYAFPVED
jgi:hypothetical protein